MISKYKAAVIVKANPGRSLILDLSWAAMDFIRQNIGTCLNDSGATERGTAHGKTSIVRKMAASPPSGWLAVFQDLEKIHTPGRVFRSGLQAGATVPFMAAETEEGC